MSIIENLKKIFNELKGILQGNYKSFFETEQYIGLKAQSQKPSYHLYGIKKGSLFSKKPQ